MSSRRDVASIAFAAVLKLRGALDTLAPWAFVDRPSRSRAAPAADLAADAKKKKKYGRRGQKRTPQQDSSRVCRLISAREVRAGDLVVEGSGARRRRRARANRGARIGTTDGALPLPSFLAVIGPRVAHVCAADRWSMVVKCNDSNLVQRRNAQPGAASNGRCLASRTASSMLPCALVARRRAEAKLVCGAGAFCGRSPSSASCRSVTPSARGMALLRLTPLDGHGLRQALKQAKAA